MPFCLCVTPSTIIRLVSAGLVHISQLAKDRVESVRDVVEENEEIYVKVLSVDVDPEGRQKISLSMKYCGQVTCILLYCIYPPPGLTAPHRCRETAATETRT